MILQHSIDYPGYNNMGYFVPDEYYAISSEISQTLNRIERPNLSINSADVDLFSMSEGELTDTQREFAWFGDDTPTVTIGETEFVIPDGEKW
jgi:hypothetical protein